MRKNLPLLLMLAFITLIYLGWNNTPKPASTAAHAGSLVVPDSVQKNLVTIIQAYGFVCPSFVSAGDRGSDHYGRVLRVRCGPVSGKGSLDQFPQYLVTAGRPGGQFPLVKPCSGMC
jgi:hypothetical protein